MNYKRKILNVSDQLSNELYTSCRNVMTILLVFVIGIHVQFAGGCRSTISKFGLDLQKFDTNQNKYNGRTFVTTGIAQFSTFI